MRPAHPVTSSRPKTPTPPGRDWRARTGPDHHANSARAQLPRLDGPTPARQLRPGATGEVVDERHTHCPSWRTLDRMRSQRTVGAGAPRRQARRRKQGPRVIRPGQPFTSEDAEASGLTEFQLRRSHRALFRGVYVDKTTPVSPLLLAKAALRVAPPAAFLSHHSAADLWGAIVPHHPYVHVTYPSVRAQAVGIFAHRRKRSQEVVTRFGVRVTSALQTFLDLSHVLDLVDLVVLGDSLVRRKRFKVPELMRFVAGVRGPHTRLAKRAAALVRAGVDSAMETRLRLLMILAGLPEPKVDHRVHDADGNLLHRFDLSYPNYRLVIEYDGRQHAESDEQWFGDIARDEQLDDWRVRRLVIVARDIYSTPGHTLSRITRVMRDQGMEVPELIGEWRRHFPGKPGDAIVPA